MAATSLQALLDSEHEVIAVLTRPDAPAGRGRSLAQSAVSALASEVGIPLLSPTSLRDPVFADRLRDLAPDCCPVVAYGGLIPADLLSIPRFGWVNLHFSLLPAWRGAAPVQWAVMVGDDLTGATTFIIEEGLDTGPILGTVTTPIGRAETSGELLDRLAVMGSHLLISTLDSLAAGEITAIAQQASGVSMAPKLQTEDARIRWAQPLIGIDRLIRATTPTPGAWTTLEQERVKIGPLDQTDIGNQTDIGPATTLEPGHIDVHDGRVWVGTATTPALLSQVQPAGKRMMDAPDWFRGLRMTHPVFE